MQPTRFDFDVITGSSAPRPAPKPDPKPDAETSQPVKQTDATK
jgi:hypothetical protein